MAAQKEAMAATKVEKAKVSQFPPVQDLITPFPHRLRSRLTWWKQWASPDLVWQLEQGLQAHLELPVELSKKVRPPSPQETALALPLIQEYLEIGAVVETSFSEVRHLIPWFLIQKKESDGSTKVRLISDCREINKYFQPSYFRMENWGDIFPVLRQGMWAAKVDLKHAYFHFPVSPNLQPYLCHQIGDKFYKFQGLCFGLNVLPQI